MQRASGPSAGPLSAPATVDTISEPNSSRAEDVGPVQTVTPDRGGFNLHAAVDPAGTLVLAWQRFAAPDSAEGVYASVVPAGASQQPVARLTPLNASRRLATLAMGPDGSGSSSVTSAPAATASRSAVASVR